MLERIALLLIRLQVGYLFWVSGYGKWTSDPPFTNGEALNGFLKKCLMDHEPGTVSAALIQSYYMPHAGAIAYLVTFGEMAVGAALFSGSATRLACVAGIFMNVNFMIAQSGTFLDFDNNGFLILMQLAILAGAAGRFLGVDYFLNKKIPNKYLW